MGREFGSVFSRNKLFFPDGDGKEKKDIWGNENLLSWRGLTGLKAVTVGKGGWNEKWKEILCLEGQRIFRFFISPIPQKIPEVVAGEGAQGAEGRRVKDKSRSRPPCTIRTSIAIRRNPIFLSSPVQFLPVAFKPDAFPHNIIARISSIIKLFQLLQPHQIQSISYFPLLLNIILTVWIMILKSNASEIFSIYNRSNLLRSIICATFSA